MIHALMSYIVVIHVVIIYNRDKSDKEDFENVNWLLCRLYKYLDLTTSFHTLLKY